MTKFVTIKTRFAMACALAAVSFCAGARADTLYVMTNAGTDIATVDVNTGTTHVIGPTGFADSWGIAFDLNGNAYGVVNNQLATYNLTTGAATIIGGLGVDDLNLAVSPLTGTFYAAAQNGNLYSVNKSTGATTNLGIIGTGIPMLDIAFNAGGALYGVSTNFQTSASTLYQIDSVDGHILSTHTLSNVSNVTGIAFDGSTALLTAIDTNSSLWAYDLLTQNLTVIGTTSLDGAAGSDLFVAPAETPLPAALPLFATGLGGLSLLGLRRKKKAAALAA
jgi:hypothetical protein